MKTSGSIGVDASRIQFDELLQVALGSACATWERGKIGILESAKLVESLHQYIHDEADDSDCTYQVWLDLLARAAIDLQRSTGLARKSYLRLFNVGKRRGGSFLTTLTHHPLLVFDLIRYHVLFGVFKGEEERIAALRASTDH